MLLDNSKLLGCLLHFARPFNVRLIPPQTLPEQLLVPWTD